MRLLILGGGGMLGHKLCQRLSGEFDVSATFRNAAAYRDLDVFRGVQIIDGVEAMSGDGLRRAFDTAKPDVVINGVGIIKQLAEAKDPILSLEVNSLLPHRLLQLARECNARLFHISTDCVFSGRAGRYTEESVSDAEDLYGRTKFLGEVTEPPGLTLRTSIIGRELRTTTGLVEWFLSKKGQIVGGYTNAIYSGFTTGELARIISSIITKFPDLTGMYHVSSEPISKYHLLELVRDAFGVSIDITPDSSVVIDRSLNSDRFRQRTGFQPRTWPEMIAELASDPTPYDQWRSTRA